MRTEIQRRMFAGIAAFAIFSALRLLTYKIIPNFYPIPFAIVVTGLILIGFAYLNKADIRILFAGFGATLGWSAIVMAILIDHTCPAGFIGFLSLACLMSVGFVEAVGERYRINSIISSLMGLARIFLLETGSALFFVALIWGIYATTH